MTTPEVLRAMAAWYRSGNEFSPAYSHGKCGCFIRARGEILGAAGERAARDSIDELEVLKGVVGTDWFTYYQLRGGGWVGPECTNDAIAACEIAADLATP